MAYRLLQAREASDVRADRDYGRGIAELGLSPVGFFGSDLYAECVDGSASVGDHISLIVLA